MLSQSSCPERPDVSRDSPDVVRSPTAREGWSSDRITPALGNAGLCPRCLLLRVRRLVVIAKFTSAGGGPFGILGAGIVRERPEA